MDTAFGARRTGDLPLAGRGGFLLGAVAVMLLIGGAVASGCAVETTEAPAEEMLSVATTQIIEDVTVEAASELIEENRGDPDFALIDVRTPDEFNEGHIEGAVMIDYLDEGFRDSVDALDRDKTYVVYCRSGRRSDGARDVMAELGFREVYNVLGGIEGWIAEGLPVVK